ncbi:switch 2-like isoform X1 [Miscanthus floridulus]|uniref:switch 2-like isoform X1 n=1 Tax=Miscanthus floridulus TaxID=154761 RepID=UPI003458643E
MSLNRLKETLHACSSSSSQPQTQPRSPPPHPALLPRRPPKTSLSQQLLRLEAAASSSSSSFSSRPVQLPPAPRPPIEKPREDDEPPSSEDEDERKSRPIIRRCPPPPPAAALEFRGPYEPLVLSLPGEHPVVQVPPSINCRLLAHQRDGVRFLYNLYRNNHGGILGDDMGLGKTIQTIAFLSSVIGKGNGHEQSTNKGKKTGPVLILCPTSVIRNWEDEFSEWAEFSVAVYHGPNRDLVLGKIETQGLEVLITSFDTFRIHDKILCGISWELVIVDEAHRLKNEKSKLYTSCLGITTQKRFGLTGTIMQNKIMELFNLFDWVVPGCLGDREHFRAYYDEPLKQGQRLSAPERFVQVADARKKHLVSVLRKFLLRRTKEETIGHLMLGKEDNIVFCKMSDVQKRVYRRMLQQPDIQILINRDVPCSCGSPLPQVECCKRTEPDGVIWSYLHRDNPDEGCSICPFCLVLPCLVKLQQISNHLELIKPNPKDEPEKQKKDAELAAAVFGADIDLVGGTAKSENFMGLSDAEYCGKMRALERLLSLWTQQGDKILLFSYSVRMLDILEKFLIRKGYCFSRFDGTTPMNARQSLVDEFNRSPSKQVFLISTRAGNLGVNLVSANRVVIFDPSWNPAQDLQAQDRSFRYGQRRHVTVFRLLGAGSLEELIYSRQIYKQQLSNIAVSGKIERRYFEGVQDDKKFQGELFGICNIFRDLSNKLFTSEIIEMHGEHGKSSATEATGIREIVDTDLFGSQENRKSSTATTDTDNQKLVDFGIVYAHRNEDVVNSRTNEREKGGTDETVQSSLEELHSKNETKHTVMEKSYSLEEKRKVARSYSLEQKRKEFSRIASFMGMDDLEFSKWLLSASPLQRSEVLQNYKRKKKEV